MLKFLKKYRIQASLVRQEDSPMTDSTRENLPHTDTPQLIRELTSTITTAVVVGIAVYIGADTARQVIVKVTPYAKLPNGY